MLVPGAAAPKLVTRAMVSRMKPGAVLVDVAIDQGGCFETSRPTTHTDPTYVVDGVVHYCVANMPGGVPRTSTYALNNATLPYVLELAGGYREAMRREIEEEVHLDTRYRDRCVGLINDDQTEVGKVHLGIDAATLESGPWK